MNKVIIGLLVGLLAGLSVGFLPVGSHATSQSPSQYQIPSTTTAAAIQGLIDSAGPDSSFLFAPGVYQLSSGLSEPYSGDSFVGSSTTFRFVGAPSGSAMLALNGNRTSVSGIKFDGNGVADSLGIITGTHGQTLGNHLLTNLHISNSIFTGFRSNVGALVVEGYYGVWLDGNEVYGNQAGIYVGNDAYAFLNSDYSHNNLSDGLVLASGDSQVQGGVYANNTNHGIAITGPPYITDITVDHVTSEWNGLNGVFISDAGVTLSNSWVFDNGCRASPYDEFGTLVATLPNRAGIQLTGFASNNQIVNVQSRGMTQGTQTYGVIETAGATSNSVIFGNFYGNSIEPYWLSSGTLQAYDVP